MKSRMLIFIIFLSIITVPVKGTIDPYFNHKNALLTGQFFIDLACCIKSSSYNWFFRTPATVSTTPDINNEAANLGVNFISVKTTTTTIPAYESIQKVLNLTSANSKTLESARTTFKDLEKDHKKIIGGIIEKVDDLSSNITNQTISTASGAADLGTVNEIIVSDTNIKKPSGFLHTYVSPALNVLNDPWVRIGAVCAVAIYMGYQWDQSNKQLAKFNKIPGNNPENPVARTKKKKR